MSKTVEEGFRIFHGRLTPTGTETEAAKRHRATIKACLENNFGMTSFYRIGSFGNGTSVRGYSDVDYLACIPTENLKQDSRKSLYGVWEALDNRFPASEVGIKSPAIYVPFGTDASESTDVVPADYLYTDDNIFRVYEIADGSGSWMKTSPDAHIAYVGYINSKLSSKVKPLIRFIKAWRYFRDVPIYPFYLELAVAKYASDETSIIYSIDIKRLLRKLLNNKLSAMQDPMGISGYISPCSTDARKEDALSKLQTAYTRAEKACDAEDAGKIADAFDWWDLVFAYEFPAY